MKLLTSNQDKIREYNRFGLTLQGEGGPDLPEVLGTDHQVILYKSLMSAPNTVVEDTSLVIDGLDVGVNVRWLMDDLLKNPQVRNAKWIVWLGHNTGEEIHTYRGEISGTIGPTRGKGFGFDPIFYPNGSGKSLAELDKIGDKDHFSARREAAMAFLNGNSFSRDNISSIPEWKGEWQ